MTMIIPSRDEPARAMTEQELKMAAMLRRHFISVDSFAWDGPEDINKIAVAMVREMAVDMATRALLIDDSNRPSVQINPMFSKLQCQCDDPIVKCDNRGCRCTYCGKPA